MNDVRRTSPEKGTGHHPSTSHDPDTACKVDEAPGVAATQNPPCQLCHKPNSDQQFLNGLWAHDTCMDDYYERLEANNA